MARTKDRQKAIELRLKGFSYSQIKKEMNISKSTLSNWLKDYPLSEKRIRELRDNSPRRIERYRATRARQKKERLDKIYKEEKKKVIPLLNKSLFIAGLFLYWGEGGKTSESRLSLSNTNPAVIKFFMKWLFGSLNVPKEKIRIYLHLYTDMSVIKEINFWSKELSVPKKQFRKPYVKKSNSANIKYRRSFNHGTCNVLLDDTRLAERILADLKVVEDKFE